MSKIARVATWSRQHADERLVLKGYLDADEVGPRGRDLIQRRVRAVRDALAAAGVEPQRIEESGIVAATAACADRSEQCRELNRRVEIVRASVAYGRESLTVASRDRVHVEGQ